MAEPTRRPLRADARRNRDRLVAVAGTVVAEQGAEASLEEIARRAGVGSATLHRHFDTRQSLLEAVFAGHVDTLCATADHLLAAPDPLDALVTWLRAVLAHAAAHRGLGAALMAGARDASAGSAFHARITEAGEHLLDRARRAGAVDGGVTVDDLLPLVNAISLAADGAPQADRLLGLVVNGLARAPRN